MAERQTVDFDVERAAVCLAGQPEVVLAYLFGSVARGEADRLSDVDVAVLLDESLGPEDRVDRQLRLMAALSDFSARETQVVLLNNASPLLAYRVVTEGILLHERSRTERIAFEVKARRVYFDWRPWEEYHTRALLTDIREVGLSGRGTGRGRALEAARRIRQRLAGPPGNRPG